MAWPGGQLGSFLNVIYRYCTGPGVDKVPIHFSLPVPCSSHLYPIPQRASAQVLPNSSEPLHAPRPCPWHLPQEAPQQSVFPTWHLGGSKAHSHHPRGLLGQVKRCALQGRGGEETITLTHGSGLKDAMGPRGRRRHTFPECFSR